MELVADRFAVDERGDARDVATGRHVYLRISSAGARPEQQRWLARCDGLIRLRHPSLAVLVDYGLLGETRRFEAWACGDAWRGGGDARGRALARAAALLQACGLTGGEDQGDAVHDREGRTVVVPGVGSGHASAVPVETVVPIEVPGLVLVDRPETAALAELLSPDPSDRPRLVAVCGPPGGGVTVLMRGLARIARARGFIPVTATEAGDSLSAALTEGRTLAILSASAEEGCRALARCTSACPRPHVLIVGVRAELPGLRTVRLQPLSLDQLVAAVRPVPSTPGARRVVEEAARGANGWPGLFAAALWDRARPASRRSTLPPVSRAAESAAPFADAASRRPARVAVSVAWPAPRELAALRRRLDEAVAMVARGRHATGDRRLRAASAALARRGDWEQAARGGLALGAVRLGRGRVRDAQVVLAEAESCAARARNDDMALDVARLLGVAWTDLGRLQEAECVLGAAADVARVGGDLRREACARVSLARSLFWHGRFDDAGRTLEATDRPQAHPDEDDVRALALRARVAVGRRELGHAVRWASLAVEWARAIGRPAPMALAASASAFVHLAVGDRAALDRDTRAAIAAARAAHDPLRALRARLIAAEDARRHGHRQPADLLLARWRRVKGGLPPILAARVALLADLMASPHDTVVVVKRHVATTGLAALALLAPDAESARGRPDTGVEDVLDILQVCQAALDDGGLVTEVCRRLRSRLRAAAVAVCIPTPCGVVPLASDGGRVDPAIGKRVVDAALPLPPHAHGASVEGGAPVRYGGVVIGALVARWAVDARVDAAQASMVLTMAATAAAPAIAGCASRREVPAADADAIIGTSAAMRDVRRAIERAAGAPFSVLIEGESGSGKELVARAIHRRSPRRDQPWCALNCAALPDDLIESELFGHARGAFTGAAAERPGVFEAAHGGTLFLDEVGELSVRAQAKLLRTIQEGEVRRVGENVARRVDVRIVAATNRDLREAAAAGRFRPDLLYRLDVVRIPLPPLRDRREDIPPMAEAFWREAAGRVGSRATLAATTLAALARYDWPGNVRELQNVLAALAVRSPRRGVIPPSALPPPLVAGGSDATCRLNEARRLFDERFVRAALARTGGHRARAAAELGVTRQGLVKLMTRLGISE
jgi:DNA-binding NtrC family response regulator